MWCDVMWAIHLCCHGNNMVAMDVDRLFKETIVLFVDSNLLYNIYKT